MLTFIMILSSCLQDSEGDKVYRCENNKYYHTYKCRPCDKMYQITKKDAVELRKLKPHVDCLAQRCRSYTKAKVRCKRYAEADSKHCWQHGPRTKENSVSGTCWGITKKGKSCKNKVTKGRYCHHHKGQASK